MSTVIETSYGKLAGSERDGVRCFRGIPFAQPPIGTLRFRPPQRLQPWAGVRDAGAFGCSALQNPSMLGPVAFDIGQTDEDCLHLNVWAPTGDGGGRPVLVWIHGGAFVLGSGSQKLYDGATLARRGDVVVVTINYRLGSFGFLNLRDLCGDALPAGNQGLLDQIAALEWVRDEIAAFGGNPANVTIFGESAGSISVATLLATPRAKGLFRRAILQSGSANFVASREQSARVADAFLHELDLTPADAAKLRALPAQPLLDAQQQVSLRLQSKLRGLAFAPTVDGEVLPRSPFEAIRDGFAQDVTVLVGSNLDEMKLFGLMDSEARSLDDAALLRRCERNSPGHGERIVETYRRARAEREASAEPPELWFAIESDRTFRYPAMHLAELQRAHQPNTYAYLFTWPSPFMEGLLGACHALELPFVFGTFSDPMMSRFAGSGRAADRLSELMQEAWLTFAHNGKPSHDGLGDWPAYDAARRATMILDADCRVEPAPLEAERRVWESV
ncbi:MAG TPA: carboxylesterase/lipase family protein [Candidatus Kryptonia bacterium]|nr:carboxylesterase/lipase family protein [Candidatus Kryptonia bacterium]